MSTKVSPKVSEDVSPKVAEKVARSVCFPLLPLGIQEGKESNYLRRLKPWITLVWRT